MELGQYTCSNPLGRWKLPTAMQLGLGQYYGLPSLRLPVWVMPASWPGVAYPNVGLSTDNHDSVQ